jgi:glycosyltransferase involved in cell wall biosynthesis
MSETPKLSVVVPLYNEDESLRELHALIAEVCEKHNLSREILFMDDGSTDASLKVLKELSDTDPTVRVLSFLKNNGKSAALQTAFRHTRGAFVVTLDADLQDDPREIPALLAKLDEGYDLVSGWKRKRYDPISKTIPSKFFNFVTGLLSGIHLHDFNCGLKAYRQEVVKDLNIYGELHRFVPVLAFKQGFRVSEIPVQHHRRKYGRTKFGIKRFLSGFLDLITVLYITGFIRNPLHLFGSAGLIAIVLGLAINIYLVIGWLQRIWIGNRPLLFLGVLLIVVGVQFFSFGLLAEMMTQKDEKIREYGLKFDSETESAEPRSTTSHQG